MISKLRIIWKQTVEQMIRCFFIRRSFIIIHSSPPADSVLTECHPTASATVTIEVSRRFVHAPKYQYHYCMLRTRLAKAPTETADRVACQPHAKSSLKLPPQTTAPRPNVAIFHFYWSCWLAVSSGGILPSHSKFCLDAGCSAPSLIWLRFGD